MRIGFFSDDGSHKQAALLANSVFNRDFRNERAILCGRGKLLGIVPAMLDIAKATRRDFMVALPLASLQDVVIRSRLDLAVVTAGASPVYRAIAMRATAFDARPSRPAVPPAWLLAGPGDDAGAAIRRLPAPPAPLTHQESVSLRSGCSCGRVHRLAIGLAAALRIAVDDPYAEAIDPAEIAELLAPDQAWGEPSILSTSLRTDLLDLAAELDDGLPPATLPPPRDRARDLPPRRRSRDGVRRRPNAPATTHEADCAYAAQR